MLKLVAYVAFSTLILASTTAVAGWLAWQAILYLIHQSQT